MIVLTILMNKITAEEGSYNCIVDTARSGGQPYFCTFKDFKSTTTFTDFITNNVKNYFTFLNYDIDQNGPHEVGKILFKNVTLKGIPTNLFTKFNHLWELNLSKVGLETITKKNFEGEVKEIKTLNLSKNKLTYLGNMVFSGLTGLTDLDLSENMLADFHEGAFDFCCDALKKLNLKSNKIKEIKPLMFNSIKDLIVFDLSENNIVEVNDIQVKQNY